MKGLLIDANGSPTLKPLPRVTTFSELYGPHLSREPVSLHRRTNLLWLRIEKVLTARWKEHMGGHNYGISGLQCEPLILAVRRRRNLLHLYSSAASVAGFRFGAGGFAAITGAQTCFRQFSVFSDNPVAGCTRRRADVLSEKHSQPDPRK